jgi:hypothetical protein
MKTIILAALILAAGLRNSRADSVFVWCGDGTVHGYLTNGTTTTLTNDFDGGNGPIGLTFDNLGNLYIGPPSESYIWLLYPTGVLSLFGDPDSISGLAFNSSGELVGTFPNYAGIEKLPFIGGMYGTLPPPYNTNYADYTSSPLVYPINLALDNSDNIYVANIAFPSYWTYSSVTNVVLKFSNNYAYQGVYATNLNVPWGLAFDSSTNLFIANSGTKGLYQNSIVKISPGGSRTTFATSSSGLNQPCGIAFDSSGNLFVANSGAGNILEFTPLGGVSVFASDLTAPTSVAIYPGKNVYSAKPMSLANPITQTNGIQLNLTEPAGLNFTVLAATNLSTPASNWVSVGTFYELSTNFGSFSGQSVYYQFTDTNAANYNARFYRVSSP